MIGIKTKMIAAGLLPYVYVTAQFLLIGAILLTGPVIAVKSVLIIVEILSIALGVWAIVVMKPGRFNIAPTIARHARLVTGGPYHVIRHPMYTAVLGTLLALTIDDCTIPRALLWILLLVTLIGKIRYEEHLLEGRFEGYGFYQEKTWRLLPYIY